MNRPNKSKSPGPALVIQKPPHSSKNQKSPRSSSPMRKSKSEPYRGDSSGKGKNKARNKDSEKKQKRLNDANELLDADLAPKPQDDETNQQKSKTEFTKENILKRKAEAPVQENTEFLAFDIYAEDEEEKSAEDANDSANSKLKKVKSEPIGSKGQNSSKNRESDQQERGPADGNYVSFDDETKLAPWMIKTTHKIKNTLVRLHNEIIDFVNYVAPRDEEHKKRETAYKRLSDQILLVFPTAKVFPFGSFATKMYLPHADIDLVLLEPNTNSVSLMNKLAKVLLKDDNYESVNVIRSAKVPLIKLVETKTGYNFDISFNKLDGVKQIKEITKGMAYYPEMKYLTILLKCFLKQRDLNETYTGGIGSFLLFCLILTFLREFKRDYISQDRESEIPDILLSEYLLKFMDFYANFDISSKQIIIAEGGAVVDKYVKEYALSVISPQEATHDVGGACFKAKEVFGVFKNRYNFLMNYNFKEGESVLKYLISADLI